MAIINGTPDNDWLWGNNDDDTITGGKGNDALYGGAGNDIYVFSPGDGHDSISEYSSGEHNIIRFNHVASHSALQWQGDSATGSLTLHYTGQDSIRIDHLGWYPDRIAAIEFSDGISRTPAQLLAQANGIVFQGSANNDTITGTAYRDILYGLQGDDRLEGAQGDDELHGGGGNDILEGGGGDDVYVFNPGDGHDTIFEYGYHDGNNRIRFSDPAIESTLRFSLDNNGHLNIHYGQNDRISLAGSNTQNMQVSFGSGTGHPLAQLILQHGISTSGSTESFYDYQSQDNVYIIDNLNDRIADSGGQDTAIITVSGYRPPAGIEQVIYLNGAKPLPYFIDALVHNPILTWNGIGHAATISYSFVSQNPGNLSGFELYTAEQQILVRQALASWADIANIQFVEQADSDNIDIRFFRDDLTSMGYGGFAGYAYYPSAGDVHISNTYHMHPDSNGYDHVLVHEIGHALGLKHPGIYNPGENDADNTVLPSHEDSRYYTQMSYHHQPQSNGWWSYPNQGPQLFDMAAIHYLYGVNPHQRTGDDHYRFNDVYIWDGGGNDTFDARDQNQTVHINLTPGSWIYSGSQQAHLTDNGQAFIGFGTQLEHAFGGSGNDEIMGNQHHNILRGGMGNDVLRGLEGHDRLHGDDGHDRLMGGIGHDQIYGGSGHDQLHGDAGSDKLYGHSGNDKLYGGADNDELYGGAGHDELYGHSGGDRLYGGAGNDKLNGGSGGDRMVGGAGNDQYWVDSVADVVIEAAGEGMDTVHASVHYGLAMHAENLTLLGNRHLNGSGNVLSNTLFGNNGNNILKGLDGNDTLYGGAGNDALHGDAGADKLYGHLGNDKLYGGAGNDELYGGAGHDELYGHSGGDRLYGGAGNDKLNGGSGGDRMVGGVGNDQYWVENVADVVVEQANEGTDTVYAALSHALTAHVDNLTLLGNGHFNGYGNALANVIHGNSGNNTLKGANGHDSLSGGTGDDKLYGGLGKDILTGGSGADVFIFDTPLGSSNVDTITDFSTDDKIGFSHLIFGSFDMDNSSFFYQDSAAADGDNRILYHKASGRLYYDTDGSGSAAAIQFAQLTAHTELSHTQFMMV